MPQIRYPKIFLRSKNDLSKRLSNKRLSQKEALSLINDCLRNKNKYWSDNIEMSDLEKNKYVRDASRTNLGKLLKIIDKKILQPYDDLLPSYIYGGVRGKNHVMATKNLLGNRRKKSLLKIDLISFFEQVSKNRIKSFFILKTKCSESVAEILSELCSIPFGIKDGGSKNIVLARGFPTSPRLSIWTNINLFNKLFEISCKKLKNKDFRISIYVDDIAIMVDKTSDEVLFELGREIREAFLKFDHNYELKIHEDNSKKGIIVIHHNENPEFLGIRLLRNKLTVGVKSSSKRHKTRGKMHKASSLERKNIKKSYIGMQKYKKYVESI